MTVEMNDFKAFIELFVVELLNKHIVVIYYIIFIHMIVYRWPVQIWLISCKHNPVMCTIYFYEASYHLNMDFLILSIKFIVKKRLFYFIVHGMIISI